jgi:hypothetical protein
VDCPTTFKTPRKPLTIRLRAADASSERDHQYLRTDNASFLSCRRDIRARSGREIPKNSASLGKIKKGGFRLLFFKKKRASPKLVKRYKYNVIVVGGR